MSHIVIPLRRYLCNQHNVVLRFTRILLNRKQIKYFRNILYVLINRFLIFIIVIYADEEENSMNEDNEDARI